MISTRTRAILSLVGVFLLGVIAGGGALGLYLKGQVSEAQSMNDSASFTGFVEKKLQLSESQRDSLSDELGATYGDLAALRNASAEEYHELIDTFIHRLAPQLDSEQRELLGRLEEKMLKRLSRGLARGGARPTPVDSVDNETSPVRPQSSIQKKPVDTSSKDLAPERPAVSSDRKPPASTPESPEASAGDSASLQQAIPPEDDPESVPGRELVPDADSLRTRLALGPEQMRSIRQIVRETRQKTRSDLMELRGFRRLQKEALRRNLREMDQRIEALLNDQQRAEYRLHREQIYKAMRKGGRNKGKLDRP